MQALSVTVGAGGALLALFGTLRRLRRDRLLADTTAMRIRSAAQGYVKVRGRAAPAHLEPTRAPLSGRPCVWWSYEIASDESERPGKSDWHTQEQATSVELFMLIDEDEARCLVGPGGRRDHAHDPQRVVRGGSHPGRPATAGCPADALWGAGATPSGCWTSARACRWSASCARTPRWATSTA